MGWLASQVVTLVNDAGRFWLVIYWFFFNLLYLFIKFVLHKNIKT